MKNKQKLVRTIAMAALVVFLGIIPLALSSCDFGCDENGKCSIKFDSEGNGSESNYTQCDRVGCNVYKAAWATKGTHKDTTINCDCN